MSLLDWQRPGFHRRSRFPASWCSFGGQKGNAAQWFHSSFWRWQVGSTWSSPCAPAALWSRGRWQSHHQHCRFREAQHQHQGMRSFRLIQGDIDAWGWVSGAVTQPSQPQISSMQVVVAAELVVREKQQCVRCSLWWGRGRQYTVPI